MSDTPQLLSATHEGAVTTLTLARPDKRNALSEALVDALKHAVENLPASTKAVVLQGEGKHFCAGLDLADIKDMDAFDGLHHSRRWHAAFQSIQFGRVPVIAALHGAVVGGGLELAAACHVRVADASTFYALPEGTRGLFLGGGGSARVPRLIGFSQVMDLMLTGRVLSAEEGHSMGISHYVTEAGGAPAKAQELAQKVAQNATASNYAIMHALPRIAEMNQDSGLLMESMISAIAQAAPEAKARTAAFLAGKAAKVGQPK
jgi:(methylthio)acryloyl-CoA hydratase